MSWTDLDAVPPLTPDDRAALCYTGLLVLLTVVAGAALLMLVLWGL